MRMNRSSRPGKKFMQPNFEVSGVLAEDQNQRNGVPLMFSISPDAGVPEIEVCDWRLFEFVGDDTPVTHKLRDTSCFLFGCDKRLMDTDSDNGIAFIYLEDESCSKQHAVIQFRLKGTLIRPYLMDLQSANGTRLNGERIESGRYIELLQKDVIELGRSVSEFVILDAKAS